MPIVLDDSLDPLLYPLAWLVGEWEGEGAIHLRGPDGSPVGRRIEQTIRIVPEGPTLAWTMRTWVLDAPAPTPPTAAFHEDAGSGQSTDAQRDANVNQGVVSEGDLVRELLLEEHATWRTAGLLPGQDQAAAERAKPGSPESFLSHAVTLTVRRRTGFGSLDAEHWAGEVRGPRIQLAARDLAGDAGAGVGHGAGDATGHTGAAPLQGTRMYGLVGGNLMWLQEMGPSLRELSPYLSVELRRAGDQGVSGDE